MKKSTLILLAMLAAPFSWGDSSHQCEVAKIETGRTMLLLFLENCAVVAGPDNPMTVGNGLTNDNSGSQTYLTLARDAAEIDSSQHMLSIALVAMSANRPVVVRWQPDNNLNVIDYLSIK